jgi:hypothetical protein
MSDWYTEDCETFADYKFKQEQAQSAVNVCPSCGGSHIETDKSGFSDDLAEFHTSLYCTSCDYGFIAVYELKSVQKEKS